MDDSAISVTLANAAAEGSRELDQACEQVARALLADRREPPFPVTSADFAGDPNLICADRYWYLRFLDQPSVRTAAECATWLARQVEAEHQTMVMQKWALGYAFVTKDSVESRTELAERTEEIVGGDSATGDIAFFATLYHAGKLRGNFWFDELNLFLESSLLALAGGAHRDEPIFVALRAFAAFGSRTITAEHAIYLLNLAWTSPLRTRHVVDLCVNAIDAAAPFDGHGELLRDHARQAVQLHPGDDILHFRLATGLHMCGEHDAALLEIDNALRLLPALGSRGSHKLLQEQYRAKREAIREDRLRAARDAEHRRRWERQRTEIAELRRTMESSAVRAVELVAIFTAAIAFAVGSLQVSLSGTLTFADRIWIIVTLGAGLLLFALLIIAGTWYITRVHRKPDAADE